MKIDKLVEENYYKFCQLEGNNYIASEFALLTILKLIKKFQVRSVLEIGLGIGSISDTVLKMAKDSSRTLRYAGTETNEFCKKALKSNVDFYSDIEMFEYISNIDTNNNFDLIIIDGQDKTLENIISLCSDRAIIFIEGDRSPQAEKILSYFPGAKHVQVITLKKNRIYSPGNPNFYVGGGRVIFINPNIKMSIYCFKEKVATYLKRHLRK